MWVVSQARFPAFRILDIARRYASVLPDLSAIMEETITSKSDTRYNGRLKKRKWENAETQNATEPQEEISNKKQSTEPFIRVKRKKVAMVLGYSGVNYYGMQRNPDVKSIEEDLFKALLTTDHISKEAFDCPQMIQFQRAARTDKGVSAIRQVVSIKLPEEIRVNDINTNLPPEIRVFSYKRVTKGFNSKTNCYARTYIYLLPTYSFENHNTPIDDHKKFRVKPEVLTEVNRLLKKYLGTRNFHNFSSKRSPLDPSSKRYIMDFRCEEPFVVNDMEFIILKVKGQSFILHQIRKMIGLLLAVVRGVTAEEIIDKAMDIERYELPKAPGLGLMLDYVHFDRYDARYGKDGLHEPLTWENTESEIEAFKDKFIFPNIINSEVNELLMASWLETLPKHSYAIREEENVPYVEGNAGDSDDEIEPFEEETNQTEVKK